MPVPVLGPGAAICAKLVRTEPQPTPVQRSTTKPVSLVALSVQVRLTCGPASQAAVRLVGAAGAVAVPTWTETVLETESADMVGKPAVCVSPTGLPIANTLYQ